MVVGLILWATPVVAAVIAIWLIVKLVANAPWPWQV